MPNHVTTEIKAPREVIAWMLNAEGRIDFKKIIPFDGVFSWDCVSGSAETAAERALGLALNDNPFIARLQAENRGQQDVSKLSDECFEQFIQMLRNHRKTGFMHPMDFARAKWGTKWNAYDQLVDLEAGTARMDTAWSFPEPILLKVSARFPECIIETRYADEDIGCNCGTVTFQGGKAISRDEAGRYDGMSETDKAKWRAFAYEVKGWQPDEDDDE